MTYWPYWAGGLALATVALAHWLLVGRLMAVSGRFTALVNRLRWGAQPDAQVSEQDLLAALQGATAEAFGPDAVAAADTPQGEVSSEPTSASRQPWWMHVLFIGALVGGGLVASVQAGTLTAGAEIRGGEFSRLFGTGIVAYWPLVVGGFLVGFGTRMAGGCTSGHGLCGVSRVQPGSLLATCAFFGSGIVTSLVLKAVAG